MNKKYVSNTKQQRIDDAKEWYNTLNTNHTYKSAIDEVVVTYKYWKVEDLVPVECKYDKTAIGVYNNDVAVCTRAAITHASKEDKNCVLDFASYTNPGGGFLKGSLSQEESICRMSGLYPVLEKNSSIYDERKKDGFTPYYGDDLIYCQDVPFIINGRGKAHFADVIVAAAPNMKAIEEKKLYSQDAVEVLLNRMELIYLLPAQFGVTVLLLGAFGCGVFGNDPKMVAEHWQYLSMDKYAGLYKQVTHPVFDNQQFKIFKGICL